jgi:hypothetical protein
VRRPTPTGAASRLLLLALLGTLCPVMAAAQPRPPAAPPPAAPGSPGRSASQAPDSRPAPRPQPGDSQNVEVDPIRCWTRTSAGAVRIGEPFDYMLTCAVIETEAVQVVADESRLGISVVQMTPFEVVGGTHPSDLRSGSRRFFQYEYSLRMINPDVIGQDAALPLIDIHYRINSRIAANSAMQGRELTYVLPVQYVRILSMVPPDATDIRDTRDASFNRIENIGFRAGVLEIVAVTLVALGGLMTIFALLGIARRTRRAKGPVERLISRPALLRMAARELSGAQRDSVEQGWTEPLVTRAVSALRIAAAGALGRPVNQRLVEPGAEQGQGRFLIRRLGRDKRMAVSSSVTGEDVARELAQLPAAAAGARRQLLEDLQATLATLSAAQYGRPAADRTTIDVAVTKAIEVARRVQSEYSWPREWLRRIGTRIPLLQRQT